MLLNYIKVYFLCLLLNTSSAYLEYDAWLNFELYHALDSKNPEQFIFRGNITIPNLTTGNVNVKQQPLTNEEKKQLMKLGEENEFYRLRTLIHYSDGTKSNLLTSTKACALINSDLNDVLWVSIDTSGSVLAITQTIAGVGICNKNNDLKKIVVDSFNTDVLIKQIELAPVPDTASFIQKLEREREARERGEVKDNRGFFAKYWMYIVPVALLVLISGVTNPEAGNGGSASGGGR